MQMNFWETQVCACICELNEKLYSWYHTSMGIIESFYIYIKKIYKKRWGMIANET